MLLVRFTEGLAFGLVLAVVGTTGSGGALRKTGFKTPWLTMLWLLLPLRCTGVILALLLTESDTLLTGLGAMGTSVSSFSVGAFFSMGVREKPLKLPKKFTEGLMLPGGLLSESLRRRLELISSGLDRV